MKCAICQLEADARSLRLVYVGMVGSHIHDGGCPRKAENHVIDYRKAEFYKLARASQPEGRKP